MSVINFYSSNLPEYYW
jgi:hypothetical protein